MYYLESHYICLCWVVEFDLNSLLGCGEVSLCVCFCGVQRDGSSSSSLWIVSTVLSSICVNISNLLLVIIVASLGLCWLIF